MVNPFPTAITVSTAVRSLAPDAQFMVSEAGDENFEIIEWEGPGTQPTKAAVKVELARLRQEWEDNQYARDRREHFPDWQEQLAKIYDDGIDKWKTEMVDPVKAKIAKP